MRITTDSIVLHWSCEHCGETAEQELASIVESGTAICPECGDDMSLGETVESADPPGLLAVVLELIADADAAPEALDDWPDLAVTIEHAQDIVGDKAERPQPAPTLRDRLAELYAQCDPDDPANEHPLSGADFVDAVGQLLGETAGTP